MIRVMLVDDHKMLREGIKQLLEFDSDLGFFYPFWMEICKFVRAFLVFQY